MSHKHEVADREYEQEIPVSSSDKKAAKTVEEFQKVIESPEGKELINTIKSWANNPDSVEESEIIDIFCWVDASAPMRALRRIWNAAPHSIQLVLLNVGFPPLISSPLTDADPLHAMIKLGLLDYKGYSRFTEETREQKLDAIGDRHLKVAKWVGKIGRLIQPELSIVEPVVKPVAKAKHEIIDPVCKTVRGKIVKNRMEREKHEKVQPSPEDIAFDTGMQVGIVVESVGNDNNPQVAAPKKRAA